MALISCESIAKTYRAGEVEVPALRFVSLTVERGEFIAIMGPSGSGKSTLMNILGCLDSPSGGKYMLDGEDVSRLGPDSLARVRNKKIGFVFQGFNLLPRTSAIENVELPLLYSGVSTARRQEIAAEKLALVGLRGREGHHPNQLSGGQQQRVAIARALVNNAPIIMADEPTGNLDTKTSAEIMETFSALNREGGITVILVTHEADIAAYSRRVIRVLDGEIVADERRGA